MAAPRRKGKKPKKFFLIAAEMRPKSNRLDQFFLHAEIVGGPLRLDAEDAFLTKMRRIHPDHIVGMMSLSEMTPEQEDEIIDNAQRRRSDATKGHSLHASNEAMI